jgi:hypothetical protein
MGGQRSQRAGRFKRKTPNSGPKAIRRSLKRAPLTKTGWARRRFMGENMSHERGRSRVFALPKELAVLFFVAFVTLL